MTDGTDRALILGEYISETGATVRAAAEVFGVSKSTVHKDVTSRLRYLDAELFSAVNKVLQKNKAERHLRGGYSTHIKYRGQSDESMQNFVERRVSDAEAAVHGKDCARNKTGLGDKDD